MPATIQSWWRGANRSKPASMKRQDRRSFPKGSHSRGQQPEFAAPGTEDRKLSLVRPWHDIGDRDTPLTFKLQQGSEERQGRRGDAGFQIEDFRLKTVRTQDCRASDEDQG